jgi:serine/threonine-protein kinase
VLPIGAGSATAAIESARVVLEPAGTGVRIGLHLDVEGLPVRPDGLFPGARSSRDDRVARELAPGVIVADRYELRRVLGRGSMGTVWLASDRSLGEDVALKLHAPASPGVETPSTSAARFRFEAQVAARLARKTRHVVRVTDHGYDGDRAYLVMERLEGQTLERALVTHGPMAPRDVAALVTQVARGLDAAHAEGVLHRDLKPSNVFLSSDEDGAPLVKILDFGIARRDRAASADTRFATANGVLFGTPGYMSPEQANAAPDLDERADLWSLAAIAYEALTGVLPVDGQDTGQLLANLRSGRVAPRFSARAAGGANAKVTLPAALERFFARAFAPRIEDRYATSHELVQAFEQAARAAGVRSGTLALRTQRLAVVRALPRPAGPASGAPALRRRAGLFIALAAAFMAATAIVGAVLRHPGAALGLGIVDREPASAAPAIDAVHADPAAVERVAFGAGAAGAVARPADPSAPAEAPPPTDATAAPESQLANHAAPESTDYGEFKTHF